MDPVFQQSLARLLRAQRVAALGTLREGAPLVSLILFAIAEDFASFYIHTSRLAQHTQDIAQDSRVSLLIVQADDAARDPQMLARVSIRGEAVTIPESSVASERAKSIYLTKFPQAARNFELGDFALYAIQPTAARFVAGFGKIFDLDLADFQSAAKT